MTEDNKTVESSETVEKGNEQDYLDTIKKLKENTVSKDAYLKLKAENKQLLDSFVNGESLPAGSAEVVDKASTKELRERLGKATNDLDYVETALELRARVLEETGKDIFANYAVEDLDYEIKEAGNVASVLQECVDLADGSPEVFKAQLMNRVIDTPILPKKKIRR